MNIRKNIDYSEMYEELDLLMEKEQSQMELYCGIGKAVCRRTEKGAAVMASEYLNKHYPDAKGFSPRSLRRMRDFYRTYENHPALLSRAMQLGWIQNVVIMEADLTTELREWYMKAAEQFGWSKTELIANIAANAHENTVLAIEDGVCCSEKQKQETSQEGGWVNANFKRRCREGWSSVTDCGVEYCKNQFIRVPPEIFSSLLIPATDFPALCKSIACALVSSVCCTYMITTSDSTSLVLNQVQATRRASGFVLFDSGRRMNSLKVRNMEPIRLINLQKILENDT